ncbi:hypothetical protein E3N88_16540 [Mikania micrantha]|uniref:UBA domain-containing protein n=1 Tax=Mikania micrantha TaxID=192012 RepID=A0A5N6NYL3_9ASTR|nr:hypothetical protein E3N88_16540 [Mikania micrantha]
MPQHFVNIRLEGDYLIPTLSAVWKRYRNDAAGAWELIYQERIQRYGACRYGGLSSSSFRSTDSAWDAYSADIPTGVAIGSEESTKLSPNKVSQIASLGFNPLQCQKEAINISNFKLEEVMNWLLSHMDDLDIDAPIHKHTKNKVSLSKVVTPMFFGFDEE